MKQELGGWRVVYTPSLRQMVDSTLKISRKPLPAPPAEIPLNTIQNCDLISLEESEFDTQSLDSNVPLVVPPLQNSTLSTLQSHLPSAESDENDSSFRSREENVVIDLVEVDSPVPVQSFSDVNRNESEPQTIEEKEDEGMMTPIPSGIYGSPAITLCDESPSSVTLGESETQSSHKAKPWKSNKRSRRRAQDVPAISLGIAFDDSSDTRTSPITSRAKRSSQPKNQITKKTTTHSSKNKNQPRSVSSSSRRTLRQTNSSYRQRDEFFGSWPTRHQSASSGTWRL
jgi:hypothetical protein